MKRQVLKMVYNGIWTVTFDSEKTVNPYIIHYTYTTVSECGAKKHKKKIAEYADFYSCLCCLKDKVEPGDIHGERFDV